MNIVILNKLVILCSWLAAIDILACFILFYIILKKIFRVKTIKGKILNYVFSAAVYSILISEIAKYLPKQDEYPLYFSIFSIAIFILAVLSFVVIYKLKKKNNKKNIKTIKSKKKFPKPSIKRNIKRNQSVSKELNLEEVCKQNLQNNFTQQKSSLEEIEKTIKVSPEQKTLFFEDTHINENEINQSDIILKKLYSLNIIDPEFEYAVNIVIKEQKASISLIQRRLKFGYARSIKLIDTMEEIGIIGPHKDSKSRDVLISSEQWINYIKPHLPINKNTNSTDYLDNNLSKKDEAFDDWYNEIIGKTTYSYIIVNGKNELSKKGLILTDPVLKKATKAVYDGKDISSGYIQYYFKVGKKRSVEIMNTLEELGILEKYYNDN